MDDICRNEIWKADGNAPQQQSTQPIPTTPSTLPSSQPVITSTHSHINSVSSHQHGVTSQAMPTPRVQQQPTLNFNNPRGGTVRRVHEDQAWLDIFAESKILIRTNPYDTNGPEPMIIAAQSSFFSNFGFHGSQSLPIPLKELFGNASIQARVASIQQNILQGKAVSEFVNLKKQNNQFLSCYVTLVSMTPNKQHKPTTIDNNASNSCGLPPFPGMGERWSVLTIRSASVVGNARHSGIGPLGTDRAVLEQTS